MVELEAYQSQRYAGTIRRRATLYLLLWLVLSPLLLAPTVAPAATALAACILLLTGPGLLWKGGRTLPETAISAFLVVYLLLSATAFVLSPLRVQTIHRLTTLLVGALAYGTILIWLDASRQTHRPLTPRQVHSPNAGWKWAAIMVLGGALAGTVGLFTLEWPSRYLVDLSVLTARLPHLSADFSIHHNQMAGLLVILLPLALALWQRALTRAPFGSSALLWALVCLFMVVVLFLTQSRNALLALLLAFAFGLLHRRLRRPWRAPFLLVLYLFLLLLPFLVTALPPIADQRLQMILSTVDAHSKTGPTHEESWLARLELWHAAVHIAGDYPVLGAGLYSFDAVSRANVVYRLVMPDFPISHAHNLFLQTAAGLGVVGVLTVATLWGVALYALWARPPEPDSEKRAAQQTHRRALATSVAAYLFFNTFDVLALEQRAGLFVWFLLALVAAATADSASLPVGGRRFLVPARRLSALLVLFWLLLLLTPSLRHANLARLQLDRIRLADRRFLSADVTPEGRMALPRREALRDDPLRLGLWYFLQQDLSAALAVWRTDPQAVDFLEGQGRQTARLDQPAGAVTWYSLALALDSRAASAYYWRGKAYEALGEPKLALTDYRRAVLFGDGERLIGGMRHGVDLRSAAWERQGRIFVEGDAWEAARVAFARAVAISPTVADYRQQLHGVETMLSQMEEASRGQ